MDDAEKNAEIERVKEMRTANYKEALRLLEENCELRRELDRQVVYELVDNTNEETFYPLGVWPTLAGAMAAMVGAQSPHDIDSPGFCDGYDDSCVLEIRQRPFGWGDGGRCVYRVTFTERYDEDRDDYVWDREDRCE